MSSSTIPTFGLYGRSPGSAVGYDSLRRGQPGDGHSVRGARHVIEARLEEELDRLRISSVLPAHAELEVGLGATAPLDGVVDQLADTVDIDRLEGVALEQAGLEVGRHHPPFDIVAGKAEGHLGEIVGPEAEEVGLLGDLICSQSGTR